MMRPKESLAIRAGMILGSAFGFCFACGVFLLVHLLRWFDSLWAAHPGRALLFGLVPLFWFVWGVRVLRQVEAAG